MIAGAGAYDLIGVDAEGEIMFATTSEVASRYVAFLPTHAGMGFVLTDDLEALLRYPAPVQMIALARRIGGSVEMIATPDDELGKMRETGLIVSLRPQVMYVRVDLAAEVADERKRNGNG